MDAHRDKLGLALRSANAARTSKDVSVIRERLLDALRELNVSPNRDDIAELRRTLDEALDRSEHRLAVYGTLGPGKANHHVIADISGRWSAGKVEGTLHEQGWGATMGYPGMLWQPGRGWLNVDLLESHELPDHWARLDAFEGEQYQRILVPVETDGSLVVANIYAVRDRP